MRLARITLFGFKSFAEKVELDFGPGITAIVGPNGSGKSNIVDAVRWVLGEQSAKLLRGDRMEDVIFKGGRKRKPLGMAEVSLTFTENRGELPIEYEEVTIARRLFRSGESEYLLNSVPCRLRDITDLFLDSGLGSEPYALIDQGTISFVVSAKPQDLKALLEEAAGIMKYKTRKRAALSKLEATQQNLLRVKDVVQEVERQLQALKRQAQKAERYRALEEQALTLKLALKLREGLTFREELENVQAEEATLEIALAEKEAAFARLEALVEEVKLQEVGQEKTLAALQESLYALRNRLAHDEASLTASRALLQELSRRIEEASALLHRSLEQGRLLGEEAAQKALALEKLTEELTLKAGEVQALEQLQGAHEAELAEAIQAFEAQRDLIIEHAFRLAESRNRLVGSSERQKLLLREADRSRAKREALRLKAEAAEREEEERAREAENARMHQTALLAEEEALRQQRADAGAALKELESLVTALQEEVGRLKSRLDSLRELEEAFISPDEGSHLLLREKTPGAPGPPGLRGFLFEALEIEPHYERAIEALLGQALRGIVTDSPEAALRALAFLKEQGSRATLLLPLGLESQKAEQLRAAVADSPVKVEGLALDLVSPKGPNGTILQALLGEGIIVQDLETALALVGILPIPFTIATLEGDVLSYRGILTGGIPAPPGPLSWRRERVEVSSSLEAKEAERSALEAEIEEVKARLVELDHALSLLTEQLRDAELDRRDQEKELLRCRADRDRLGQELALLDYEAKELHAELQELKEALDEAEWEVQEAEDEGERLEAEGRRLEAKKADLERRQRELSEELLSARVLLTSLLERREGARQELERLHGTLDAAREEARRLQVELAELQARKGKLEGDARDLQEALSALAQEEQAQRQTLAHAEEVRRLKREEVQRAEEALRPLRQEISGLQSQRFTLSTKQAELKMALSRLEEELKEHQLTLGELQARFPEAPDPLQAEEELERVKAKLSSFGPVNLAALEEHEALSTRHAFLAAQAADLEASIETLQATVTEVEKTIERLFRDTLAAVNHHFDRLWQRLFEGGEARLELAEAEEGEEPGLEMVLQLPGKRPSAPFLLSGGERSLAALALLLALFSVKPSPFCLFDEVDAPLDDANVARFVALLKDLSTAHQSIVITHNKRTMEAASVLYGITTEDGASKLVSVKIEDPHLS